MALMRPRRLVDFFLATAELHADRIAIEHGPASLSYGEVKRRASGMACALSERGLTNKRIGIFLNKCPESYIAVLAILMVGGAFVPISSNITTHEFGDQVRRGLFDAVVYQKVAVGGRADILLQSDVCYVDIETCNNAETEFIDDEKRSPQEIAYIMLTSGSTGRAKAVPISNRGVCDYIFALRRHFAELNHERFSQVFDLTFDLSVHDQFFCWATASTLVVPLEFELVDAIRYIDKRRISVWFSAPSLAAKSLLRKNPAEAGASLVYSLFCGEPLAGSLASGWKERFPNSRIFNLYGPTEATIAISVHEWNGSVADNGTVPIGRVLSEQEYVLVAGNDDADVGELLLGGSQITSGYLDSPEKNVASFRVEKFDGKSSERWYRTGDLVSVNDSGDLVFHGRLDRQIKLNGIRVELLALEACLREILEASFVCILALQDENFLTAKIHAFSDFAGPLTKSHVREMSRRMPHGIVPDEIFHIDEPPLNKNGKVDYGSLRDMTARS
jgi:D-alanine--poly(phosphoribitol) ligase subunit 1